MADIGDRCSNGPWESRWTCPACYHDHDTEVDTCAGCGVALLCEIWRDPVPVCTIIDPADRNNS